MVLRKFFTAEVRIKNLESSALLVLHLGFNQGGLSQSLHEAQGLAGCKISCSLISGPACAETFCSGNSFRLSVSEFAEQVAIFNALDREIALLHRKFEM